MFFRFLLLAYNRLRCSYLGNASDEVFWWTHRDFLWYRSVSSLRLPSWWYDSLRSSLCPSVFPRDSAAENLWNRHRWSVSLLYIFSKIPKDVLPVSLASQDVYQKWWWFCISFSAWVAIEVNSMDSCRLRWRVVSLIWYYRSHTKIRRFLYRSIRMSM